MKSEVSILIYTTPEDLRDLANELEQLREQGDYDAKVSFACHGDDTPIEFMLPYDE